MNDGDSHRAFGQSVFSLKQNDTVWNAILAMAFARARVLVQSATKALSNGGVESRRSLFRCSACSSRGNRPRSLVFCIGPMLSQEHRGTSRDSSRCPIGKASGWHDPREESGLAFKVANYRFRTYPAHPSLIRSFAHHYR